MNANIVQWLMLALLIVIASGTSALILAVALAGGLI